MLHIGTSGWQYDSWRGVFYPEGLPKTRWLEHYATRFSTVESNNTFYRLPQRATFEAWRDRTPTGFVMAVKVSRFLTHLKRLSEPAEPVARFLDRVLGLGPKLGPALLQLPPTLTADPDLLDQTLRWFPAHVRVAVEPRHPTWWTAKVRAVLEQRGAALCWADRAGTPVTPLWRTADFGYLRLHHGTRGWSYDQAILREWVARIARSFGPGQGLDVYVYFNNDPEGAAVSDAVTFTRLARTHHLTVSRASPRRTP